MRLLLTGGHGGIGSAIWSRFKKADYEVVAPRHEDFDLAKPELLAAWIKTYQSQPFHAFIHCAGINHPQAFEQLSIEDIQLSFTVNTVSFVRISQILIPGFQSLGGGHILGISSLYGFLSRTQRMAYALSKHALNGAMKTLALELGQSQVLVNNLAPGFIDTVLTRKNNNSQRIDELVASTALKRLGTPEDISEVAFFLASPVNRYITGQSIVCDGGYSVGGFQKS